jgi:DnaK suppressor protein
MATHVSRVHDRNADMLPANDAGDWSDDGYRPRPDEPFMDWSIELRTRDRQRKLVSKIEAAIRRIDEGEYGYCEVTGEPISLGRLEARPIATMTLEAQERHERNEKISRED